MVSVEKDLLIIDGDSHVLEPPNLWDEYLEPEFRPRAILITRSVPGRERARAVRTREPRPDEMPGHRNERAVMVVGLVRRRALAAHHGWHEEDIHIAREQVGGVAVH